MYLHSRCNTWQQFYLELICKLVLRKCRSEVGYNPSPSCSACPLCIPMSNSILPIFSIFMTAVLVLCRFEGSRWSEISHLVGSSCRRGDQLCWQHRGQEPLHHCCKGYQGSTEQTACCWSWWSGSCYCEERQTGVKEKGLDESSVPCCSLIGAFYLRHLYLLVMPAVVVRQRKPYRRKDGTVLYFEGML